MTTQWGSVEGGGRPSLMAPGDTHAEGGRSDAGEWAFAVDDAVVSGSLVGLRKWLNDALKELPPDRHELDLVTVDEDQQMQWLNSGALDEDDEDNGEPWQASVESVRELLDAVAADPAAAGWQLNDGVTGLWAELDEDTGDLTCGVTVARAGLNDVEVGIGNPLTDEDLAPTTDTDDLTHAAAVLGLIAKRINYAY